MQSLLKTGLIGYGYAGKTFHSPLIAAVPGLELAAVASSDAAKVHADWPAVTVDASPEALLRREDIGLVVIATPNDSHFPLALAALQAGKHVVVDKPFTLDVAQARELSALAQRQQRLLSVFHNRRWDGDFLTVQALLHSGTLGRVVHLESHFDRFRPLLRGRWREAGGPGGGLWFDLGPHLLDQALCLFGPPLALQLDADNLRDGSISDDWWHAQLRYERLRVTLHASTLVAAGSARFAVHGTRGSFVKLGLDRQEDALKAGARPLWPHGDEWGADPGPATLITLADAGAGRDAQTQTQPWPLQAGRYADYYAAVLAATRGEAANPVPPEQAIDVMALIELGLRSVRERRELPFATGR